jgi:hypothetical protein
VQDRLSLGIVALAILSTCIATPRYAPGKHYFLWANLYVEPPIPSAEISEERARQLASEGKPIYEVEYDSAGRMTNFQSYRSVARLHGSVPDGSASPRP